MRSQTETHWHTIPESELCERLETTRRGLTNEQAEVRLTKYGPNSLPQKRPNPVWFIVLRQFCSPLIYILVAAAFISIAIGDSKDAAFIAGVLVLNAMIGAYQEWKAEKSSAALKQLLQIHASVYRDGDICEISAEQVVPGDVVWMESGNRVPADIRLLTAHGLEVDESLLTGESLAIHKDASWEGATITPVADRLNMAYAGSIVTRGRAKGLVVATGNATNVGRLARDVIGEDGGRPPLLVRMERFVRVISIAVLTAAVAIGVLGVTIGTYTPTQMFLFAIALAVSAIPEGLPVAMTVALAIATTRMAKRRLIVRKLTAVEGLGSCTLIATDKTGTLTCNELTVRQIWLPSDTKFDVTGEGFVPIGDVLQDGRTVDLSEQHGLHDLTLAGVLCNESELHHRDGSWVWHGDAVDVALLALGVKLGFQREDTLDLNPQLNQIPFEAEHQFAATYHKGDDADVTRVYAKGAPERILSMCAETKDSIHDLLHLEEMAAELAKQGYRVLALADGTLSQTIAPDQSPPPPSGLRFLGFVGMIDPLRPGAKEAVEQCHQAGIAVSMITGDHQVTALAIARELGLANDESQVTTGTELLETSPEELRELVGRIRVFARVAPRQKLQIVEAAREAGQFVAVTGDGVNDAPALQTANIGVAMGSSGTDVAREAAELVISDDNFSTIVAGVEEGRVAYDNVRKVIYLLVSTGAAELVLMALAVATGTPFLPLLPVQILWLNLVTNGIQDVALAFEPSEGDVLKRRPRPPKQPIFDRLMIERTIVAALVIGVAGFLTFRWFLPDGASDTEVASARNALLLLMVLFENIHIGNCRSETKSALWFSPLRSPILLAGAIIAFLVHLLAMYTPLGQELLKTQPIALIHWGALILLALIIFPAMELHKWSWRQRYGDHS